MCVCAREKTHTHTQIEFFGGQRRAGEEGISKKGCGDILTHQEVILLSSLMRERDTKSVHIFLIWLHGRRGGRREKDGMARLGGCGCVSF